MTGCFLFMGIILINKIKNIIICGEWLRKIYLEFWLVCAKCSQLVLLYSSNSVEKPFYEITENKKAPTNT